jgi:glutathione S-transferase
MSELVLTTFDWVPEPPRGLVRDLRVRWALEEAGLPYRIASVPFKDRGPEHFAHQPFGQVPFLSDGDLSIFESGAILLHIAEKSPKLMPTDARGRSDVIKWLFAALNSVEMAVLPQVLYKFTRDEQRTPGRKLMDDWLTLRLGHMEKILTGRTWLTDAFSVADILMADVLRALERFDGLAEYPHCRAYVERATARPAFKKAYADQMAHFAKAD